MDKETIKKIKSNRSQGKRRRTPHTEQLTRIIIYLEEIGRAVNRTTIVKDTLINTVYVLHALQWLVKYGLIKKKEVRKRVLYYRVKGGIS